MKVIWATQSPLNKCLTVRSRQDEGGRKVEVSAWNDFAKLIGVAPRDAEAALYSERAARASLSRRGMFGASAALAAGVVFGFPVPSSEPRQVFLGREWYGVFEFPLPAAGNFIYFDTDGRRIEVAT